MTGRRQRVFTGGLLGLMAVLAGCTFNTNTPDKATPTIGTPVAWATHQVEAMTAEATALPTMTSAPTLTPAPSQTAAAAPLPSRTPFPTLTDTPAGIISLTAPPTLTNTPFKLPPRTAAPTLTNTPLGILTASPAPTLTPGVYPPPPTFTPVIIPQTPVPTTAAPPSAQVCPTCENLRLRAAPGTAGDVITMLAANVPLSIIGRTADNAWVQVVASDGQSGWVASEYLLINIDLNVVSVTSTASDAPAVANASAASVDGIDVVSGVTSNARLIFQYGRSLGNSAYTFTRVGDSITASELFLTPIGQGNYSLGNYGYLQGVISFFSGPNARGANPFSAASIAARNSWGADSVLNPGFSDPNICRNGETPLACEYRVTKPSVALIMVGTNDSGGIPAAEFQANLQMIVQTSINMGVIPVLSTIPPKHYNPATDGRVDEFNQIIVATARAYDIPLWNYWLAMRRLPGEGLHPDGVHPSAPPDGVTTIFDADHLQYGYTMRNLTALQVLYTLWQQVLYDGNQAPPIAQLPAAAAPEANPVAPSIPVCEGALPPRLTVGQPGRVTPGEPNKLRSAPSVNAEQIGNIPGEAVFSVLGGPQCADGYYWWQVSYNGQTGWTANGSGSEYWVEPYP